MHVMSIVYVSMGASLGAVLRYFFGLMLNGVFPTLPLGTLTSNILGGFLMGAFLAFTRVFPIIPEVIRLSIVTGFLGGLSTFSTFSAELFTLLSFQQYFFSALLILAHLGGSIIATYLGFFSVKFFLF